jgi:uncharacterized repeat protein (TIGR03847 family)
MSMRRPHHNMGRVDWIGAEALGLPGQRRFRLMAQSETQSAQLWLEKQQLQALAEAIAQMLAEIDAEQTRDFREEPITNSNPKPPNFPESPEIEFQVVALQLRYDSQRDLIALEAFDQDPNNNEPPEVRCLISRKQIETLQINSMEVIAAGRPLCPLCGTALSAPGMPHFCPPTNGHQRLAEEDGM